MDRPLLGRLRFTARIFAMTLAALAMTAGPSPAQFGYGGYGGGYGGNYGSGFAPGIGLGGFGPGYGYGYGPVLNNPYRGLPDYAGTGLAGLGYPGIGGPNPYFGMGVSPLAVQNVYAERALFGRPAGQATPFDYRSIQAVPGQPRPGTGSFGTPR